MKIRASVLYLALSTKSSKAVIIRMNGLTKRSGKHSSDKSLHSSDCLHSLGDRVLWSICFLRIFFKFLLLCSTRHFTADDNEHSGYQAAINNIVLISEHYTGLFTLSCVCQLFGPLKWIDKMMMILDFIREGLIRILLECFLLEKKTFHSVRRNRRTR